jgi:hypothetical protein
VTAVVIRPGRCPGSSVAEVCSSVSLNDAHDIYVIRLTKADKRMNGLSVRKVNLAMLTVPKLNSQNFCKKLEKNRRLLGFFLFYKSS